MQCRWLGLSNSSHQIILSVWNANYDMACASYNKDSWTKPEEVRVRGFALFVTVLLASVNKIWVFIMISARPAGGLVSWLVEWPGLLKILTALISSDAVTVVNCVRYYIMAFLTGLYRFMPLSVILTTMTSRSQQCQTVLTKKNCIFLFDWVEAL